MSVPAYYEIFNPLLQSLRNLGGSGSNTELVDETAKVMNLADADLAEPHTKGRLTKFEYRSAWARTYLKKFGLIDNSDRGVWTLTEQGKNTAQVDTAEVRKYVRELTKSKAEESELDDDSQGQDVDLDNWRTELLRVVQEMDPSAFERLCQRLLRESGFIKVQVTGKPADGGIDGIGSVRIGGLLSFPIIFQCKRYQGSVGPKIVRDFRGAMVGRADRGLILTTGNFTAESRKEATRDGAPPIDLVDGDALVEKLKELRLGVHVEMVEQATVKRSWFDTI